MVTRMQNGWKKTKRKKREKKVGNSLKKTIKSRDKCVRWIEEIVKV